MIDIRLPNITGTTEREQLIQVKSYLHQLAEQLQWALQNVDTSNNASVVMPTARSLAPSSGNVSGEIDAQATFASIKSLIIKSAEIVDAYYDEINAKLEGLYVAQSDFGAFVDIGGIDGMVHISEMSWKRIKNPSEIFEIGQEVEVYIKAIEVKDDEKQKISLGYKKIEDDPWQIFTSKYAVGNIADVEIQGLATTSGFGNPRRMAAGFDYNRMAMLIAILEKRAGYFLGNMDCYVNIVGGLKADEPASDLAVALSIVSSLKDAVIDSSTICFGEIGLAGEIRTVNNCEKRIRECERLGFKKCIIPRQNISKLPKGEFKDIEIIGVRNVREAFEAAVD